MYHSGPVQRTAPPSEAGTPFSVDSLIALGGALVVQLGIGFASPASGTSHVRPLSETIKNCENWLILYFL